jgi:predicted porin
LSTLAAGAAFAQSSVTIYGVTEVGLIAGHGSLSNKTQLSQGNLMPSRLGFRGVEDLGGGMSALFNLEAGLNVDDGGGQASNTNNQSPSPAATGIAFNRLSWVALAGSWGQVRFGRDWTPTFTSYLRYDVANGGGLGGSQAAFGSIGAFGHPGGLRASNAFQYFSPTFNGISANVMYALGENASNAGATKDDGNYLGARVSYVGNGLDAGLAYGTYKLAAVGDIHETTAGATYAMGRATFHAMYTRNTTGTSNNMWGGLLGAGYLFGATEARVSLSNSRRRNSLDVPIGDSTKLAVMVIHSMSKRTAIYGIAAATRNANGASSVPLPGIAATAPNANATGFALGVRHMF